MYKTFAADPRSVRLGLASDGFNPFGMLNVTYTTWPVILMPYNLPPWLCFKQSYWMMAMLIPGPKSPGINIDVYLQPLIDELKDLWDNGVTAWDAKKRKISLCVQCFFGQSMIFLHMQCCLVGAQKAGLHVHTVTRTLSTCG